MCSELFDSNDCDSIMEADISPVDKKIYLRKLKYTKEGDVKKIIKKRDKDKGIYPFGFWVIVLFLLYVWTRSIYTTMSILFMIYVLHLIGLGLHLGEGNGKKTEKQTLKGLDKEIKKIDDYVRIIERSE